MYLLFIVLIVLTALLIWALHRSQRLKNLEVAERSGPLPQMDGGKLAISSTDDDDADNSRKKNWLNELRAMREQQRFQDAYRLAAQNFPRVQAFHQAAIISRQEIRDAVDTLEPANAALEQLYRTAVLADLFRTENLIQPGDPGVALLELENCSFPYVEIGYRELKLLNKSDIRHVRQLWGEPDRHRHAEEVLGEHWARACLAGAE